MLEIFLKSKGPLTYDYFLSQPSLRLNRVTIFRVLNLFAHKNIIHRIRVADNMNRYLLQQAPAIVHSSFFCSRCKKVIALETVITPKVKLPEGFRPEQVEIVIEGVCKSCDSQTSLATM
jgi:Fur family ferric uptake transcriptional regulator